MAGPISGKLMQISFTELAVGSAAVWRVTHLIHAEDGPWESMARFRKWAGQGMTGKMLACFYCASVWAAAPVAAMLGASWKERLLLWPALSGAAILMERATAHPHAEWHVEQEQEALQGESDELLWTPAHGGE